MKWMIDWLIDFNLFILLEWIESINQSKKNKSNECPTFVIIQYTVVGMHLLDNGNQWSKEEEWHRKNREYNDMDM